MDAVVFDLGGVLVDWDPRALYDRILPADEVSWFLEEVCTPGWNAEMDAGRPQAEATAELAARWPAYAPAIEAWRLRWPEMLRGEIAGSVALLRCLHGRGVPLYAGTNWSAETFPHAIERFDFLSLFRGIHVSGQERIAKPAPAFFTGLCARFGLTPSEAMFIDDNADNVRSAASIGMDAVRFTDPSALRAALEERRLL